MYLIIRADRNAGNLHLNGTRTDMTRCKQLAPFAIAERFIIAKPRRTRLSYRLSKTSYLFRTQITAAQWRKGRNEQVNIQQRRTFILQARQLNGGRGQDASKKTYSRCLFYHLHALITIHYLYGQGATDFHAKTPEKQEQGS